MGSVKTAQILIFLEDKNMKDYIMKYDNSILEIDMEEHESIGELIIDAFVNMIIWISSLFDKK